jgi:hypothetical protein
MEVHHHSHTERKKWSHYLWEFLMLFLAVFCGFLAENQREHFVEHQREKVYINQFLNDLTNDTIAFSRFIENSKRNELRMDSLILMMKTYKDGDATEYLYYLARILFGRIDRLQYNKRTYNQLKNSGGLRLIRKKNALDSLSLFFESLEWVDLQNQLQVDRQTLYGLEIGEVFNAWTIDSIFNTRFTKPNSSPPLLTTDTRSLNRFIIRLHILKGVVNFNMTKVINDYLPVSKRLIILLKKEYHLE